MIDYKRLYHIMIDGSEAAIAAMTQQNYGLAKRALIRAERKAEELYIETAEEEADEAERSDE